MDLKRILRNGNYYYFGDAPIHTTGVSLNKSLIAFTTVGQTEQLVATVTPADAVDTNVTWSSSDTSIATVDDTGLVTCVTPGSCTITVTTADGGYTDTCSVADLIPVESVSLNESSARLNSGETLQLVATITPSTATIQSVTWTSSNPSIATVDSNGLVSHVSDGNVTITCTTVQGGLTATCSVECYTFTPIDTCFGYTGSMQCITLQPHSYCLEVWGAKGGKGCGTTSAGYSQGCVFSKFCEGKGGYSTGVLTLTSPTTLYIHVGGKGVDGCRDYGILTGGYNGGGNSGYNTYFNQGYGSMGGSGGGGTDIRINYDSLYARVIVAGGGGGAGAGWDNNNCGVGGNGGGVFGCTGVRGASNGYNCGGGGASLSAGGCAGWGCKGSGCAGTFGVGGNGDTGYGYGSGGGGGGGWYGGGAGGQGNTAGSAGGGGGSGYTYTSTTATCYPSGGCLNSNYYLTNAYICPGSATFPTPSGSTETGHYGNGCVRIRSI